MIVRIKKETPPLPYQGRGRSSNSVIAMGGRLACIQATEDLVEGPKVREKRELKREEVRRRYNSTPIIKASSRDIIVRTDTTDQLGALQPPISPPADPRGAESCNSSSSVVNDIEEDKQPKRAGAVGASVSGSRIGSHIRRGPPALFTTVGVRSGCTPVSKGAAPPEGEGGSPPVLKDFSEDLTRTGSSTLSMAHSASSDCTESPPPPIDEASPRIRFRHKISNDGANSLGVYAAVRSDLGATKLAVKVQAIDSQSPRAIERARFEAHVLMHILSHRNIIRVLSYQESANRIHLTMERAVLGTLFDYITTNGVVEGQTAMRWAFQLFDAMAHAHSRGIVHGDLKPENILLTKATTPYDLMIYRDAERPLIADWGFAKLVDERGIRIDGARPGTLGSAAYSAFELLSTNYPSATKASDVWSMGVLLYAITTKILPFGKLMFEVIDAQTLATLDEMRRGLPVAFPALCGAPPQLKAIIRRMLQARPEDRPTFEQLKSQSCFQGFIGWEEPAYAGHSESARV